ncbi:MAG: HAD-IB family phosphatase [Candidatus Zixiibacteriota bacterium]
MGDKLITVVIPTLNEEETIASVVGMAARSPSVLEVLVIDDKSVDRTVPNAREAGATVITSTKLGKGASMRDGLLVAKGEVLVFLDGDIGDYSDDIVERLAEPILTGRAAFVKSRFTRQAGRVTELVARPLLSLLFPDLLHIRQPLSGMISARKSLLAGINFEEDYGVDIGLLIDMHLQRAVIEEVDIQYITNRMKPWPELGKMSREVARAILKRASASHYLHLEDMQSINVIRDQMEHAIQESLLTLKKLAVFDMDNTILRGRFVETAAKRFGMERELIEILAANHEPWLRTKQIARLFRGRNIGELIEIVDSIPYTPNSSEIVAAMKSRGYIVGIISDSYDFAANHVKTKIGADFALANELEFSQSMATGEVKIPSFFARSAASICSHSVCKTHALVDITARYEVGLSDVIAIGDSEPDVCMIKHAGIGVSFCSRNELLNAVADFRISEPSFKGLLDVAQ